MIVVVRMADCVICNGTHCSLMSQKWHFVMVVSLQLGNTLRRCCEQAPDCDCNIDRVEENSPVLLPSPTEVMVPEMTDQPTSTPYWVTLHTYRNIDIENTQTASYTWLADFSYMEINHWFIGLLPCVLFILCSIVSPPMCGCCWDILLWWSFTF